MNLKYALLYVDDVEKTMNFYAAAFGLVKGFLHESKEYGEMVTGETTLGFVHHDTAGSHGFTYTRTRPDRDPPAFELGFVTDDVEGGFKQAVAAGAVAVSPPTKKPWGQVVGYVRDPNGFLVELGTAMG